MDNALQALRQVDFDWTAHIDQIWNDGPADVSSLQVDAREELGERLVATAHTLSSTPGNTTGRFVLGQQRRPWKPERVVKGHLVALCRCGDHNRQS